MRTTVFRKKLPRPAKAVRRLGGKPFKRVTTFESKKTANRAASRHRRDGFRARLVPLKVWTPSRGGFRSIKAWGLYIRKKRR